MIRIDSDNALRCPKCGQDNLTHESVTVVSRDGEAPTVRRTIVTDRQSITDVCANAESGNPSDRANGLFIRFSCGNCGAGRFDLTFAQHKGRTYVEWR